ncbi:MAG: hypothetical protein M3256_21600 [Actinomycetota bacterium]|nr:hypothetical protein [Actinomycetota bacterium]
MNDTAVPGTLAIGEAVEDWTGDARFFEYSQAADPIGAGAREISSPCRPGAR